MISAFPRLGTPKGKVLSRGEVYDWGEVGREGRTGSGSGNEKRPKNTW